MRSTFGGLEIGKRGLFAQQTALNTVGHNIANANTPGYSRQRVNMEASRPIPFPGMTNDRSPGQTGTGAIVKDITRLRDEFLDRQFRNESKYVGYYEARKETLSKIETILKEGSGEEKIGLQPAMDRLWGAWQDLVNGAENGEVREEVIGYAKGMIDVFNHISRSLKEYQADLNNLTSIKVQEINSIAQRISDLNAQVARLHPHGYATNDLDDQRDYLIDQLAKLVDVEVIPGASGMINIRIAGGQDFINGTTVSPLQATANPSTGFLDVSIAGGAFAPTSGSLLETLESRGIIGTDGKLTGVIPNLLEKFNTLATALSKEVNDLHRTGKNLQEYKYEADPNRDPNNPPKSELPFFVSKKWLDSLNGDLSGVNFATMSADNLKLIYPQEADDMVVNPLIVQNTDLLAAGKKTPTGTPATGIADGTTAQAIANIKNKLISVGLPNTTTLDGYYSSIIGDLGVQALHAENLFNTKSYTMNHVDFRRQAVTGVSLDDEMVDMIRFQQAYAAAARTITTMDQMLDRIINGMGVVGR